MKVADWIIETELQGNVYDVRKEGNENKKRFYIKYVFLYV